MSKIINLVILSFFLAMTFSSFGQVGYTNNAPCSVRPVYKGCQGQSNCPRPRDPRAGDDYFDWTTQDYFFYLENGSPVVTQPTTTKSPWFTINNPNVQNFYSNPDFQDNKPQDGWELVMRKFGTANDPANGIYGEPTKNPYLVLYNKYTATLRIFVLVTHTGGNSYNQATVNLYFKRPMQGQPNYRSALMEHLSKNRHMNALEEFDNQVTVSKVANDYHNSSNTPYWLYADFAMAYDPCSCNYKSNLMFDVSFISQTNLQFTLRGKATPSNLTGQTGSIGGRTSLLQEYEQIGNILAKTVNAGSTAYTGATNGIEDFKKFANTGPTDPGYTYPNPLPFVLDMIPGLAGAVSGTNFFIAALNGGKKESQNDKRNLIYDIDLKAEGTMTTQFPYSAIDLPMPGGDNITQLVPPTRLMYNNIMGIATVLTKPTVYYQNIFIRYLPRNGREYATYYKLKDEDVKYLINPNIGEYVKAEAYGSLEMETQKAYPMDSPIDSNWEYNATFDSYSMNTKMIDSARLLGHIRLSFPNMKPHKIRYRTTTYPLTCLKKAFTAIKVTKIAEELPNGGLAADSVYVKFLIRITKNIGTKEQPIYKQIVYSARYLTKLEPYPAGMPPMTDVPSGIEAVGYQNANTLGCTNFPFVFPCIQDVDVPAGQTQYWYSFGAPLIGGIRVNGGGTLVIKIGTTKEDGVTPQYNTLNYFFGAITPLEGDIRIEYGLPPLCEPLTPQATATELREVCNSNQYKNRVTAEAVKSNDWSAGEKQQSNEQVEVFKIFPNPANEKVIISYQISQVGETKILISNTLGVVVQEILHTEKHEIGSFEVSLNTQNLSSGMYICTLQTAEGVKTNKLLISK
jgi:hypothetical protein